MFLLCCISLQALLVSGASLSEKILQSPDHAYKHRGDTLAISCSHSIQSYDQILWYRQTDGLELQLLGYMYGTASFPDKELNVTIDGDANRDKTCTITITGLSPDSSAVYFCAARNNYEAYFGQGTKLTVLENGSHVTAPTVRILQPSKKVCKDKKGKTKRKTLVCVASRFYPDHVSVSWKRNDETTIHNVSTDATATATKTTTKQIFYKITSRLMVQQSDWLKPKTKFTCIVSFYDGKTTINKTDTFTIKSTMIPGMTRENYIKISQNAKLSYSVLIVKSCLYAALVCFLVWKLQGKLGKQTK